MMAGGEGPLIYGRQEPASEGAGPRRGTAVAGTDLDVPAVWVVGVPRAVI